MLKKIIGALALTTAVASAHADVVTFEGISGAKANDNNAGLILTADPGGFDWTSAAGTIDLFDETRATVSAKLTNIGADMGTSGEQLGQWVGYINSTGNVSFASTTSFDFTSAYLYAKTAQNVSITGFAADGTQLATTTVSLGANASINATFSQFTGVSKITIAGSNVAFDNITTAVAAVPEASTYAMLLAGLGMIGVIARRRTNA
jgi:hypothetical protein